MECGVVRLDPLSFFGAATNQGNGGLVRPVMSWAFPTTHLPKLCTQDP